MMELFLMYLLLSSSFSISSLFFIHIPAVGYSNINNSIILSLSYMLITLLYFPKVLIYWLMDDVNFKKALYNG